MTNDANNQVVVTGIGCLGPFGLGVDSLQQALATGIAITSNIDRSAGYHRNGSATQVAAAGELDLTPWLSDDDGRRMSQFSQHAVTCARMALSHAGLDEIPSERTAVTIATAFGPGGFTERLALQVLQKGGKFASPFLFTDCVANAAAGQIAIATGARGANLTICQREAGPLLAIAQATNDLRLRRADVCLAGSVDELQPLSYAILDRFRALARPTTRAGTKEELPRPFDANRNGYLAGDGGTILVLEREQHAKARGARILARVCGSARAFDPTAPRTGHGRGSAALAACLQERLGEQLRTIDTVISAASGARRGDALEAEVLRLALPEMPQVLAPKSVTGEFGGGTLGAAMLALMGTNFGKPQGCTRSDPSIGIELASGAIHASHILCSAHAAGGVSSWLTLSQP
ncbi:MAG: 3-oxoacyl-(acyl-carrier-protein) synthase [Planctomycetota bacterium]|jgi:3-oxoacyl-(acyl-carrier-protein) synthase